MCADVFALLPDDSDRHYWVPYLLAAQVFLPTREYEPRGTLHVRAILAAPAVLALLGGGGDSVGHDVGGGVDGFDLRVRAEESNDVAEIDSSKHHRPLVNEVP